jgi:hypothetical protein
MFHQSSVLCVLKVETAWPPATSVSFDQKHTACPTHFPRGWGGLCFGCVSSSTCTAPCLVQDVIFGFNHQMAAHLEVFSLRQFAWGSGLQGRLLTVTSYIHCTEPNMATRSILDRTLHQMFIYIYTHTHTHTNVATVCWTQNCNHHLWLYICDIFK